MMHNTGKETIAVAMSGGVDSSVAAALLVSEGFAVIGVTMKLWHSSIDGSFDNRCCSVESVEAARRVARRLGIDHIVLNVSEEFHRLVVSDFVDQYSRGLTPNPCVVCNARISSASSIADLPSASTMLPQAIMPALMMTAHRVTKLLFRP